MNIRDHLHLFAGEIAYGHGSTPRKFLLNRNLTPEQRREALALVQAEYPLAGYGTELREHEIMVGSAD